MTDWKEIIELSKMFNLETTLSILVTLGVGGIIGAFIKHLLDKTRELQNQSRERKIETYSSLINYTRGFMGDPVLSYDEALKYQQEFIKKFYNDVLLFSSKDVIKAMDCFFDTVSISHTNRDEVTDALLSLIKSMRQDLGLESCELDERYKFYTVNVKDLKKKKGVE